MKSRTRFNRSGRVKRGAFTLVELMVVITIMAALVALSASAVLKFIGIQQASNTQSTLDRVQSQLAKAWVKAKDQVIHESISPQVAGLIQPLAGTITDPNLAGREKVIYYKLRMRQIFPMNFGEALNVPYMNPALGAMGYNPLVPPSPLPALPGYTAYLMSHGVTAATVLAQAAPAPYESSVCLLMALQLGVSGAGINPEELTAGGASGALPNGLPYLTDAWGRPIFFSRAPAGNPYLNPSFPTGWSGTNDPGDPQGYLQSPGWATIYGPLFTPLTLQVVAPANSSYKLAPMVASGGPSDWTARGTVLTPAASSFDPITFAPVTGGDALFSTP